MVDNPNDIPCSIPTIPWKYRYIHHCCWLHPIRSPFFGWKRHPRYPRDFAVPPSFQHLSAVAPMDFPNSRSHEEQVSNSEGSSTKAASAGVSKCRLAMGTLWENPGNCHTSWHLPGVLMVLSWLSNGQHLGENPAMSSGKIRPVLWPDLTAVRHCRGAYPIDSHQQLRMSPPSPEVFRSSMHQEVTQPLGEKWGTPALKHCKRIQEKIHPDDLLWFSCFRNIMKHFLPVGCSKGWIFQQLREYKGIRGVKECPAYCILLGPVGGHIYLGWRNQLCFWTPGLGALPDVPGRTQTPNFGDMGILWSGYILGDIWGSAQIVEIPIVLESWPIWRSCRKQKKLVGTYPPFMTKDWSKETVLLPSHKVSGARYLFKPYPSVFPPRFVRHVPVVQLRSKCTGSHSLWSLAPRGHRVHFQCNLAVPRLEVTLMAWWDPCYKPFPVCGLLVGHLRIILT